MILQFVGSGLSLLACGGSVSGKEGHDRAKLLMAEGQEVKNIKEDTRIKDSSLRAYLQMI